MTGPSSAAVSSVVPIESATIVSVGFAVPTVADVMIAGGMGRLSPGQTAWTEVDRQPGTCIALCFVFDPETGMPHLMLGMVDTITVGEGGAADALPTHA